MFHTKEMLCAVMVMREEVRQAFELQLESMLKDKDIICKEDMARVMELIKNNSGMLS